MRLGAAAFAACLALPGLSSAVQAQVGPPAAIAAARAAMSDTTRGAQLRVVLLTVGQGDAIWERYGHNLLWISNLATGESIAWNWGVFNFDEPGFIRRFLFASAEYKLDSADATATLNYYARTRREVIGQELALTAGQRAALDAYVRVNARPENIYYRYDYFLDNCSTRLRDALDIVLGGVLRPALESSAGGPTYRSETLRLNQHDSWLFLGLDLALGLPADHSMNAWEAGFVPMRLRDALRTVSVKGPNGAAVSLVKGERVIVRPNRDAEPGTIGSMRAPLGVLAGSLALSVALLGLGAIAQRPARGSRAAIVGIAVAMHVALGFMACLLLFMWCFTRHAFWAWNPHLLLFTPLSLAVAISLARTRSARPVRAWVARYHLVMAASGIGLTLVVLAVGRGHLTPSAELLLLWASSSWLIHIALGMALSRLNGASGGGPVTGAPAIRSAA